MGVNIADGNDRVPVQAGVVLGRSRRDRDDHSGEETPQPVVGETVNVRSGDATVGRQEDVIVGGLRFGR